MCDYSLMNVPNRLANEGEELVTHRFPTGALGLASPSDLPRPQAGGREAFGSWAWFKQLFSLQQGPAIAAVCIPPGSRLLLRDIPHNLQKCWHVRETEEVTFTQVTAAAATFRDAVRFKNGCQALFQELSEGQSVRVLDMSLREPEDRLELEEQALRMVRTGRSRTLWSSSASLGSALQR
jgi:hypothetical protein